MTTRRQEGDERRAHEPGRSGDDRRGERGVRELRYLSLGFLLLTVGKVFLYDLANVGGIYRVFSFLGLGISLILVSLFYQRFVFKKEVAS